MDPSEYEGTVTRVNDPFGATLFGDLEQLLAQNSKFVNMNLSKESDGIHLSVFKIKESLQHWNEVSFNSLRLAWDNQAEKIAEYKEEVSTRKKVLAAKIRPVMSRQSSEAASELEILAATETKELITAFKAEFDFLTTTNRFSESAFLSTYKLLRDVPDPSEELGDCLRVCVRAQETLKNAQLQLNIAEKTVEDSGIPSNSHASAATEELMTAKYNSQIGELEQKYQADIVSLREKIDLDMRNREHSLRSAFERQQLDLQQQFEDSLARKESELSSVMNSLNAHNQRSLEGEERQHMLESEVQKRRELEERLRATLTELAAAQISYHEIQAKYDTLVANAHAAEISFAKSVKSSEEAIATAQSQLRAVNERVVSAESELLSRPPADLSALAQSVGMVGGALTDLTFDQNMTDDQSSSGVKRYMPWSKIEAIVVDCIRRASSEATESRVKELEAVRSLDAAKEKCDQLHMILTERDRIVAGLEKDLLAAHKSVNAGNALLKCYNPGNKRPLTVQVSDSTQDSSNTRTDEFGMEIVKDNEHKHDSADLGWDEESSPMGGEADLDIEKGSGGRGVAAVVLGESSGGDRMMAAVQGQRDRFMKIAHAKEAEVNSLRILLERVTEEKKKASDENLELFKRLRLQRASSRRPTDGSRDIEEEGGMKSSSTTDPYRGNTSPSKSRSRRDVRHNSSFFNGDEDDCKRIDGDAMERKYMHLYEEKIDPFKLEELDRQSVLSRMNIFERGLAYLSRFFLHDQWARHALMVYLVLVHGFALCYVFQVLNPQLIEEVDYHLKAKWSAETLNIDVTREHPDTRFRY